MNLGDAKSNRRRVAVIGAGITGLSAANRLTELDSTIDLCVLEAGDRVGGVVQTERYNGFTIELGPDNFITEFPWGLNLCQRLGFSDELIGTNEAYRQSYVVRDGRLRRLPKGLAVMAPTRLWPMVSTRILSLRGKLRLGWEYFIPPRTDGSDESLAAFARRRLGRETFERLIQPLVSGIYMADAERLSMRAALPRFVEMECKHGSLIRAARRQASAKRVNGGATQGPRYSMFVTPRKGLASLVSAVAGRLPQKAVHLNCPVNSVARQPDGRWILSLRATPRHATVRREFDALIVATPSHEVSRLLASIDTVLAEEVRSVLHASCVIVVAAYPRNQIDHALEGFGFVVPQVEQRNILACTFSSVKYSGRAPEGSVLFRVFLGGTSHPELIELDDDVLEQIVRKELGELVGVRGKPMLCRVSRLPRIMPQYDVGHLDRIRKIEARVAELPGLALAGNAYRGVGIPHCIHSGEQAAEQIVREMQTGTR